MPRLLTVYQLDTVGYEEALSLQKRVMAEYAESLEDAGTLILLEHPPVLTIGRSGTEKNILASSRELESAGVRVIETNRGGDVTYHGPGQIVGYPILPLAFHGKDVHRYLRRLEAFLIATLWEYGIKAERKEGFTGVWTPTGKIASIGVAITHWVSLARLRAERRAEPGAFQADSPVRVRRRRDHLDGKNPRPRARPARGREPAHRPLPRGVQIRGRPDAQPASGRPLTRGGSRRRF